MSEVERKVSRPNRAKSVRGSVRASAGGFKDILTVRGCKSDYQYYWAFDDSETGARIYELRVIGWDFVKADEVEVGQSAVYKTNDIGSLVRVPAGKTGGFLYLMKIPKEIYEAMKEDHQAELDEVVAQIQRKFPKGDDSGFYSPDGGTKIRYE